MNNKFFFDIFATVLVLGKCQQGKSTIIKQLGGEETKEIAIGDGLMACTKEMRKWTCPLRNTGRRINFMDVQGLDDDENYSADSQTDSKVIADMTEKLK